MNRSMVVGIALFVSGAAMLSIVIPMLMLNPDFLGYSYLKANNSEINLLVQLLALGSMLVPFGLIFVSKGRKINKELLKGKQ